MIIIKKIKTRSNLNLGFLIGYKVTSLILNKKENITKKMIVLKVNYHFSQ